MAWVAEIRVGLRALGLGGGWELGLGLVGLVRLRAGTGGWELGRLGAGDSGRAWCASASTCAIVWIHRVFYAVSQSAWITMFNLWMVVSSTC